MTSWPKKCRQSVWMRNISNNFQGKCQKIILRNVSLLFKYNKQVECIRLSKYACLLEEKKIESKKRLSSH